MAKSDCFNTLVFEISQQLNQQDHEALNYIYKLPDSVNSTKLGSLKELQRRGAFSSSNLEGLTMVLKSIHRSDLIEVVNKYTHYNDIRLRLCHTQAIRFKEQLAELQKEHDAFSMCDNLTPSMHQQFYKGMSAKLKSMQDDCTSFLIVPLQEMVAVPVETRYNMKKGGDEISARGPNNMHKGSTISMLKQVEVVRNAPDGHIPSPHQTTPKAHKQHHSHLANTSWQRSKSRSHSTSNLLDIDYDKLQPSDSSVLTLDDARVFINQRENRMHNSTVKTKVTTSKVSSTNVLANSEMQSHGVPTHYEMSQYGRSTSRSTGEVHGSTSPRLKSRIPVPSSGPVQMSRPPHFRRCSTPNTRSRNALSESIETTAADMESSLTDSGYSDFPWEMIQRHNLRPHENGGGNQHSSNQPQHLSVPTSPHYAKLTTSTFNEPGLYQQPQRNSRQS